MKTIKKPEKVHDKDVYKIRTQHGQTLNDSLLSQEEYNYVERYLKRYHPRNVKLSRKEHPLAFSVVFDEKGQPFVLYRGKSVAAQIKQGALPAEKAAAMMSRWDFTQEKLLGKGAFGRVKIAQNMHSGQWGAVKVIPTALPEEQLSMVDAEVHRERFFLGKYKRDLGYAQRTDPQGKRYLFQTLIEGEQLWDWVAQDKAKRKTSPEEERLRLEVALKATQALYECHKKAILHRDVKLENFLIDSKSQEVALIDFGLSRSAGKNLSVQSPSLVGTRAYQAPELQEQQPSGRVTYDEYTESYALGWVLGAILLGKEFFTDFSYYSEHDLKALGYDRYGDFLQASAPEGLAKASSEVQSRWAEEDTFSPARCPLARLCLEAAHPLPGSQARLGKIPQEKMAWYQLVGEMLSAKPRMRPDLEEVQHRLKRLKKSLLVNRAGNPSSFGSQLFSCFRRPAQPPSATPSVYKPLGRRQP